MINAGSWTSTEMFLTYMVETDLSFSKSNSQDLIEGEQQRQGLDNSWNR